MFKNVWEKALSVTIALVMVTGCTDRAEEEKTKAPKVRTASEETEETEKTEETEETEETTGKDDLFLEKHGIKFMDPSGTMELNDADGAEIEEAYAGDRVYFRLTPDSGYKYDIPIVETWDYESIETRKETAGYYSFVMPDKTVNISVISHKTSDADDADDSTETEETAPQYVDSFINFDEMNFYINGKKYTLGQTTLQELFDDGVPFEYYVQDDAETMLDPDTESSEYSVLLDGNFLFEIAVLNNTGSAAKMRDCCISEAFILLADGDAQDLVAFDFPLDITQEELIAKCGEPQTPGEVRHFENDNGYYSDTIEYKQECTKYYGYKSYSFEYVKGELSRFTLHYTP